MNPTLLAEITERQWQDTVLSLARLFGWAAYHTYNSQRSEPGFPDLVLVRPPELVVVELKSEKGKVTFPQKRWLSDLNECGVETYVWRPSNWSEVEERLRRPRSSNGS